MSKHIPPCDGDCFNCKRPVEKCHGGQRHVPLTPYVQGARPLDKHESDDFGAVHLIGSKVRHRK